MRSKLPIYKANSPKELHDCVRRERELKEVFSMIECDEHLHEAILASLGNVRGFVVPILTEVSLKREHDELEGDNPKLKLRYGPADNSQLFLYVDKPSKTTQLFLGEVQERKIGNNFKSDFRIYTPELDEEAATYETMSPTQLNALRLIVNHGCSLLRSQYPADFRRPQQIEEGYRKRIWRTPNDGNWFDERQPECYVSAFPGQTKFRRPVTLASKIEPEDIQLAYIRTIESTLKETAVVHGVDVGEIEEVAHPIVEGIAAAQLGNIPRVGLIEPYKNSKLIEDLEKTLELNRR